MKKTLLILGLGMQGKAVLYDLLRCEEIGHIIVADSRPDLALELSDCAGDGIEAITLDLGDQSACLELMRRADIVVETLPAPFTLPVAELAVTAGVHLVNCSYLINPLLAGEEKDKAEELIGTIKAKALEKNIIVMSEFGLDPGIDLVMANMALSELDHVDELHMFGSGLPDGAAANNPLGYKFSWSIMGVMKAYKRPARMMRGGKIKVLGAEEIFEPDNVGTLAATPSRPALEFYPNGDAVHYAEKFGLDDIAEMGRYTCRLPGHSRFWEKMVKCGFLESEPVMVSGKPVVPIEFITALLGSQDQFHYGDDERDLAYLRLEAKGQKNGKPRQLHYELLDKRDLKSGLTAMQRCVGFMMTSAVKLILQEKISQPGLYGPMDIPYGDLTPLLAEHGIEIIRIDYDF